MVDPLAVPELVTSSVSPPSSLLVPLAPAQVTDPSRHNVTTSNDTQQPHAHRRAGVRSKVNWTIGIIILFLLAWNLGSQRFGFMEQTTQQGLRPVAVVYAGRTFHEEVSSAFACLFHNMGYSVVAYVDNGYNFGGFTLPFTQKRIFESQTMYGRCVSKWITIVDGMELVDNPEVIAFTTYPMLIEKGKFDQNAILLIKHTQQRNHGTRLLLVTHHINNVLYGKGLQKYVTVSPDHVTYLFLGEHVYQAAQRALPKHHQLRLAYLYPVLPVEYMLGVDRAAAMKNYWQDSRVAYRYSIAPNSSKSSIGRDGVYQRPPACTMHGTTGGRLWCSISNNGSELGTVTISGDKCSYRGHKDNRSISFDDTSNHYDGNNDNPRHVEGVHLRGTPCREATSRQSTRTDGCSDSGRVDGVGSSVVLPEVAYSGVRYSNEDQRGFQTIGGLLYSLLHYGWSSTLGVVEANHQKDSGSNSNAGDAGHRSYSFSYPSVLSSPSLRTTTRTCYGGSRATLFAVQGRFGGDDRRRKDMGSTLACVENMARERKRVRTSVEAVPAGKHQHLLKHDDPDNVAAHVSPHMTRFTTSTSTNVTAKRHLFQDDEHDKDSKHTTDDVTVTHFSASTDHSSGSDASLLETASCSTFSAEVQQEQEAPTQTQLCSTGATADFLPILGDDAYRLDMVGHMVDPTHKPVIGIRVRPEIRDKANLKWFFDDLGVNVQSKSAVIRSISDLKSTQFYYNLGRALFLVTAVGKEAYFATQATSSIPAALITQVPVVTSRRFLALYPCLRSAPMHVFVNNHTTECESMQAAAALTIVQYRAMKAEVAQCGMELWQAAKQTIRSLVPSRYTTLDGELPRGKSSNCQHT